MTAKPVHALIGATLMVGAFFGGPLVIEGTSSPCGAVLYQAIRAHPGMDGPNEKAAVSFMGPAIARGEVEKAFPALPAGFGCPVAYWGSMINPNLIGERQSSRPRPSPAAAYEHDDKQARMLLDKVKPLVNRYYFDDAYTISIETDMKDAGLLAKQICAYDVSTTWQSGYTFRFKIRTPQANFPSAVCSLPGGIVS